MLAVEIKKNHRAEFSDEKAWDTFGTLCDEIYRGNAGLGDSLNVNPDIRPKDCRVAIALNIVSGSFYCGC